MLIAVALTTFCWAAVPRQRAHLRLLGRVMPRDHDAARRYLRSV